jgi:hypothetical protein
LIIKRQFSGDYVKGDDTPKIDLREEGAWTVNKRNELTWTLSLKPAEERTVKFQYTVLINSEQSFLTLSGVHCPLLLRKSACARRTFAERKATIPID